MKRLLFALAVLPIVISSCSPTLFTFKTQPKRNEIVITPEMKSFTAANKNPTVVLRVPSAASSVTEQERQNQSMYNDIYNRIEKNLVKAGFTVRDRGLLNNLMSTGQVSYAEIAKKIETDVMIEIQGIGVINNFSTLADVAAGTKKITINRGTLPFLQSDTLNAHSLKIDCKLTLVNKGSTGALLTLYSTQCANGNGCNFYCNNAKLTKIGFTPNEINYHRLNWTFSQDAINQAVDKFSDDIISALRGNTY